MEGLAGDCRVCGVPLHGDISMCSFLLQFRSLMAVECTRLLRSSCAVGACSTGAEFASVSITAIAHRQSAQHSWAQPKGGRQRSCAHEEAPWNTLPDQPRAPVSLKAPVCPRTILPCTVHESKAPPCEKDSR